MRKSTSRTDVVVINGCSCESTLLPKKRSVSNGPGMWLYLLAFIAATSTACSAQEELRPGLEFEKVVATPAFRNDRVNGDCYVFRVAAGGYEWEAALPRQEGEYEGRLIVIESGGGESMWGMGVFVPDGMQELESLIAEHQPNAITENSPHTGWCGP